MIYYDYFAEEYVTEKDDFEPPERYLEYIKGAEGIYIERFIVYIKGDDSFRLDFAYSEFQMTNYPQSVAKDRLLFFERNGISKGATRLAAYVVPPSVYEKIVKEWELNEKGDE